MNCHHHDFVPSSPHTHSRVGNRAMSEIVIPHDVNHPLTTSYYTAQDATTPEQQKQRERNLAMAKAEAVTSRYRDRDTTSSTSNANQQSHERRSNWVAQQQQQQPPRRTSAEPGRLALSDSFRAKSNSSLGSSTDDNINDGSGHSSDVPPPPPPLKTEVTDLVLTPKQQRQEQYITEEYYSNTTTSTYSPPDQKVPAKKTPPPQQQYQQHQRPRRSSHHHRPPPPHQHHQQQPRRVSDSFAMTGASTQYRQRASFQANENRYSSIPTLPPRKPAPLYPDIGESETRLVAAMAVEEQARLLSQLQLKRQQDNNKTNYRATTPPSFIIHDNNSNTNQNTENKSLAILEQEKLWKELSGSHQSFGTAATAASSTASSPSPPSPRCVISPQEEQARLWEQIQLQHQSQTSFSLGGSSSSWLLDGSNSASHHHQGHQAAISPIDEQARMLEAIQQQQQQHQRRMPPVTYDTDTAVAPNSFLSTVEAQERMLRALASSSDRTYYNSQSPPTPPPPPAKNPLEEQAKRLREIQEEKDKQIVEMACKISFATEEPPHPSASASADDEVTLEVVMELSRQEAAEAQAKAELADQQALQVALSQSRGELLGPAVDALVVDDAAGEEATSTAAANDDLEIRRSIAELACQSSERTLEETADQPATRLSYPTPRNRNKPKGRRSWGLGLRKR